MHALVLVLSSQLFGRYDVKLYGSYYYEKVSGGSGATTMLPLLP